MTPAQSQREQKRAAHQRLFLVSEELKDPWNKPPGSRHSAFLTVCSFEGVFKAASERNSPVTLAAGTFPPAWVTKIQGSGRDETRVGSIPFSQPPKRSRCQWGVSVPFKCRLCCSRKLPLLQQLPLLDCPSELGCTWKGPSRMLEWPLEFSQQQRTLQNSSAADMLGCCSQTSWATVDPPH